jgi:hypothetical protein
VHTAPAGAQRAEVGDGRARGARGVAGLVFALVYYAAFSALDRSGWVLGAVFGLVHVRLTGTALVNVLLPAVHPRMGTPVSAANSSPYWSRPGSCF